MAFAAIANKNKIIEKATGLKVKWSSTSPGNSATVVLSGNVTDKMLLDITVSLNALEGAVFEVRRVSETLDTIKVFWKLLSA